MGAWLHLFYNLSCSDTICIILLDKMANQAMHHSCLCFKNPDVAQQIREYIWRTFGTGNAKSRKNGNKMTELSAT